MKPKTASAFLTYMEQIWDDDPHKLYGQFKDAIVAARDCGMRRTGGTRVDGENWEVWRFPTSLNEGVRISLDGCAVAPAKRRFRK